VPQDYAEAVKWYRKAADQGNAVAQYDLGVMYDKGQGVPQNFAVTTAKNAAKAGTWVYSIAYGSSTNASPNSNSCSDREYAPIPKCLRVHDDAEHRLGSDEVLLRPYGK
jgi:TPR repeat protein